MDFSFLVCLEIAAGAPNEALRSPVDTLHLASQAAKLPWSSGLCHSEARNAGDKRRMDKTSLSFCMLENIWVVHVFWTPIYVGVWYFASLYTLRKSGPPNKVGIYSV